MAIENKVLQVEKLEGSKWSPTLGAWHLPDTAENRGRFKIETPLGKSVLSKISVENQEILKRYIEHIQLRGYSFST